MVQIMVTKQKIFDQLYLLWDVQGWTYTSQKFHVPRSREIWDNKGVVPPSSLTPPPLVSDVIPNSLVSEGLISHAKRVLSKFE